MPARVLWVLIFVTGGLCLFHTWVWPLDPRWIFRGAFTVFSATGFFYFLFFKKWRLALLIGAVYSSGWILMLGWYLYLFHFVREDALEERENKLLAEVCRDAVMELRGRGVKLDYQGSLSVRGPKEKFVFFENFNEIRKQFFHLGDFLLVVKADGRMVEVVGGRELATRISGFGLRGDAESGRKIREALSEKILESLSRPSSTGRQERKVEKIPAPKASGVLTEKP